MMLQRGNTVNISLRFRTTMGPCLYQWLWWISFLWCYLLRYFDFVSIWWWVLVCCICLWPRLSCTVQVVKSLMITAYLLQSDWDVFTNMCIQWTQITPNITSPTGPNWNKKEEQLHSKPHEVWSIRQEF